MHRILVIKNRKSATRLCPAQSGGNGASSLVVRANTARWRPTVMVIFVWLVSTAGCHDTESDSSGPGKNSLPAPVASISDSSSTSPAGTGGLEAPPVSSNPSLATPDPAFASANVPTIASITRSKFPQADDPLRDGWDSEVFSRIAQTQLTLIMELLVDPKAMTSAEVASLLAPDFFCTSIRPENLNTVYEDGPIEVRRFELASNDDSVSGPRHHGAEGLQHVLEELRKFVGEKKPVRSKIKIVRVQQDMLQVTATAILEIAGRTATRTTQVVAEIECRWQRATRSITTGNDDPKLLSLVLRDYEQAVLSSTAPAAAAPALFRECTPSILDHTTGYRHQLAYGSDYWAQRVEARLGANFMGYHGVTVGDMNGDGLDDLYVCQPGGIPNLVFLQNADG